MAATPQGRQLTEQHRLQQQQVRAQFLTEFLVLWQLLDSTRLEDTSPGWIQAVLRLIQPYRARSAQVAVNYYLEFQAVEAPATPQLRPALEPPPNRPAPPPAPRPHRPTPHVEPPRRANGRLDHHVARPAPDVIVPDRPPAVRFDFDPSAFDPAPVRQARIEIPDIDWSSSDRAVKVSLEVTGPIAQKSKTARKKPLQVARDESFTEAAGAASRHVLTGGRQSLLTLLKDDPQALGWARVTDGDPCAFCALLASRGPVYKTEESAGFQPHDACACQPEPVYSQGSLWPGRGREYQQLYRASTRGYSGRDAVNAFRRAYEAQQREQRNTGAA